MDWLSRLRLAASALHASPLLFRIAIVVALAVLGFVACSNSWRQARWVEVPHACDWFIFLRQAKLFQQNGPIGGLDTAIRDENSRYLIEKAKKLGSIDPGLPGLMGPYCHFYRASTDRLSIVSPPGTGLGLSLFPAGKQARLAFMAYTTLVFAMLVLAVVSARRWTSVALAGVLGVVCFLGMYRFVHDWSIQLTVPFLVAAGYATVRTFEKIASREGALWALLLGLLLGFAGTARTANVLLVAGAAAGFGVAVLQNFRGAVMLSAVLFGAGLLVGYLPVFAANAINAGQPLTSTYSAANTDAFRFDWEMVRLAIAFYVAKSKTSVIVGILVAAVLAVLVADPRKAMPNGARIAALAGLTGLLVTFAFFAFYEVRQPYYLFAGLVYAASTAVFVLIGWQNARGRTERPAREVGWRFRLGAGLFAIAAVLATQASIGIPVSKNFQRAEIDFAIPPKAVIWASSTVGYYHMFLDRQAAVLLHFGERARDRLVESIAADGVAQFIAADPGNEAVVDRLRQIFGLRRAGSAFGYDVFEIRSPAPVTASERRRTLQ